MARVPARGGVAASLVFLDRLAGRSEVHALHHVLAGHLTLSRRVFQTPRGVRAVVADADPEATLPSLDLGSAARMRDLVAVNGLRPVAAVGGLSLWMEDGGAPADSTARVAIAAPATAPPGLVFDGALVYEGAALAPARGTPGGLLTVRARWRRVAPVARLYVAGFVLTDARGGTALAAPSLVGGLLDPVHLWPAGVPVTATDRLVLPRDLAPGRYSVGLRLGAWDGRTLALAAGDDRALAARHGLVDLGTIEIAPRLAGENHAP